VFLFLYVYIFSRDYNCFNSDVMFKKASVVENSINN
jgi:hypothetical protein